MGADSATRRECASRLNGTFLALYADDDPGKEFLDDKALPLADRNELATDLISTWARRSDGRATYACARAGLGHGKAATIFPAERSGISQQQSDVRFDLQWRTVFK